MSAANFDLTGLALAIGVVAAFGWYFWRVFTRMRDGASMIMAWSENRAAIEADSSEALLRRTGQIASLTGLVAILAYALLRKFNVF